MDKQVNKADLNNDELHMLDYVITLAKYSRMIIFSSLAATVLAFLIAFILPNKYTATGRILSPQQNYTLSGQILDMLGGGNSSGASSSSMAMGGMAALLGKTPGDFYVAMLKSNTVLDNVISRFNLMALYKAKNIENARDILLKNTEIKVAKESDIIVISFTNNNPRLSAEIANAFIEELDKLLQGISIQEAKSRLVFLEKERLQTSQNLTKAEESLRLFSEKNNVLQIDTQTRGALEYIARLRAEIDAKEVSIKVLRQQATPFNYDVVRLETEVAGLKEKLHTAEVQQANCYSNVCIPTDKAPSLGLEYFRLFRDFKYQDGLYQLLSKLVEIARMDMVRNILVVRVVDTAKKPSRKSNSRLIPGLIFGIITIMLMIVVAFILEHAEHLQKDDIYRFSLIKHYLHPWESMFIKIKNVFLCLKKR